VTILAAAHAVSSNAVVPGVLGFLVVAGMSVALFFLFRSMNKHLRKVAPPPPARSGPARSGGAPSGKAAQASAASAESGQGPSSLP
jgi:hypothetical protein